MSPGVSLAFRLDDPSPASDHALERRLIQIFARRRVPLTVAAIPFAVARSGEPLSASPATLPHLMEAHEAGEIEVALHGHSHVDRAPAGAGPSEYRGVALTTQRELLAAGKACLAGVFGESIAGFVPPWNTYDEHTLTAAADNGFAYLSAGDWTPAGARAVYTIPRTCRLDRLPAALREARRYAAQAPVVVVVLHPDNFAEFRSPPTAGEEGSITDLPSLDALLVQVTAAGPDVRCLMLSELARERRARRLWWRRDPGWLGRLPDRVRARLPRYVAFSTSRTAVLWQAFRTERET